MPGGELGDVAADVAAVMPRRTLQTRESIWRSHTHGSRTGLHTVIAAGRSAPELGGHVRTAGASEARVHSLSREAAEASSSS